MTSFQFYSYIALIVLIPVFFLAKDFVFYVRHSRKQQITPSAHEPVAETLTLLRCYNNQNRVDKYKPLIALAALLIIPLFSITIVLPLHLAEIQNKDNISMIKQISSAMGNALLQNNSHIIALILLLSLFPILYYKSKILEKEKLTLDKKSISYTSPLPAPLKFIMPDWSLQWQDIKTITSGGLLSANCLNFYPAKSPTCRHLIASTWQTAETHMNNSQHNTFIKADQQRRLSDPENLMATPLLRYITQHTDILVNNTLQTEPSTDLLSCKRTLSVTLLLLILLAYAFIDFMLITSVENYLTEPPWWIETPAIAAFIGSMLYLNRSQSHIFTRTGLSLLLTIIVFIACYPAALRVNQLSDTQGLQTYTYIKTGESSFHPIDAELPSIRLTPSKYWDSIKNNASVNFELRKGGLGFYQLNMRTVYEKISHWQCTQDVLAKKKNIGDCTTDD